MAGYADKYRTSIKSRRLQGWDYSSGVYFVTLCVKNVTSHFGDITNGKMHFSNIGRIVERIWLDIPNHSYNARLDEFCIMPNHLHGIVEMKGNISKPQNCGGMNIGFESDQRIPKSGHFGSDVACYVATRNETVKFNKHGIDNSPSPDDIEIRMSKISVKPGTLSAVIRSFKSACTNQIREQHPEIQFDWQPRFHDHIIRNHDEFERIRWYIRNNPKAWQKNHKN